MNRCFCSYRLNYDWPPCHRPLSPGRFSVSQGFETSPAGPVSAPGSDTAASKISAAERRHTDTANREWAENRENQFNSSLTGGQEWRDTRLIAAVFKQEGFGQVRPCLRTHALTDFWSLGSSRNKTPFPHYVQQFTVSVSCLVLSRERIEGY